MIATEDSAHPEYESRLSIESSSLRPLFLRLPSTNDSESASFFVQKNFERELIPNIPIPPREELAFYDGSTSLWQRVRQYQSDVVTLLEKEMERCESVWTATVCVCCFAGLPKQVAVKIDSQERTITEQRELTTRLQLQLQDQVARRHQLQRQLEEAHLAFERVKQEKLELISRTAKQMEVYTNIIHMYQDHNAQPNN